MKTSIRVPNHVFFTKYWSIAICVMPKIKQLGNIQAENCRPSISTLVLFSWFRYSPTTFKVAEDYQFIRLSVSSQLGFHHLQIAVRSRHRFTVYNATIATYASLSPWILRRRLTTCLEVVRYSNWPLHSRKNKCKPRTLLTIPRQNLERKYNKKH